MLCSSDDEDVWAIDPCADPECPLCHPPTDMWPEPEVHCEWHLYLAQAQEQEGQIYQYDQVWA